MAANKPEKKQTAGAVAGWLLAFMLAVYLVNYHGHVTAADEISMLTVAKNLLKQQSFDATAQVWAQQIGLDPAQEGFGVDGRLYSKKGPGQPAVLALLMAPGFAELPL